MYGLVVSKSLGNYVWARVFPLKLVAATRTAAAAACPRSCPPRWSSRARSAWIRSTRVVLRLSYRTARTKSWAAPQTAADWPRFRGFRKNEKPQPPRLKDTAVPPLQVKGNPGSLVQIVYICPLPPHTDQVVGHLFNCGGGVQNTRTPSPCFAPKRSATAASRPQARAARSPAPPRRA